MIENKKAVSEETTNSHTNNSNRKSKPTQEEILLKEFVKGREMSQLEAITQLGIGHLSSLVSKMRLKYGIPVRMEMKTSECGSRYASYSMDHDTAVMWLTRIKEVRGW